MERRKAEPLDRMLQRFRTHLLGIPLSDRYVDDLVKAVREGWGDPVRALTSIRSSCIWRNTVQAWKHWCEWTNHDEPARSLARLRRPRALPPKPRTLPNDQQLREAAESAAGLSLPAGPLLWILCLSGLRIAEVCGIERLEAEEALRKPEIQIRAKGHGFYRRTWVPGPLVRAGLEALLRMPWRSTWVLLSGDKRGAIGNLRKKCHGGFHPHDFRHAVARLLRRLGYQDSTIAGVLGHNLAAVMGTTGIYAPPSPEELEQAHASIAWHLWPNGYRPPAGSWLLTGGFPGSAGDGATAAGGGG